MAAGAQRGPVRPRRDSTVRPLQLGVVTGLSLLLMLGGTVGFVVVRGDGWVSSLYRTVTIVTTAGMADPPQETGDEVLTAVLLVTGVGLFLYGIGLLLELVVRGAVGDVWALKITRRRIERMDGHHLVCGYGRVGRRVAEELRHAGQRVVVVDVAEEAVSRAAEEGVVCVHGSAADEQTLCEAGVERARSLVACAGDDAVNTFIVLTAKGLRADLQVVARASADVSAPKLERAGANEVVSPYAMAGRQIARLLTRPHVTAFLSAATGREDASFSLEEVQVPVGWPQAGMTLGELRLRERTGATVLALRRPGGALETHPTAQTPIEAGTILVSVGTPEAMLALERVLGERRAG